MNAERLYRIQVIISLRCNSCSSANVSNFFLVQFLSLCALRSFLCVPIALCSSLVDGAVFTFCREVASKSIFLHCLLMKFSQECIIPHRLSAVLSGCCPQIITGIVATSPVALRWLCDSPRTGCAWRTTPYIYVARTSNKRVIVAWKLCRY